MKRPVRNEEDGMYHIKNSKYPELFGSRTQVMNKTAYKTSGNLTKEDLMMNKWGRIVSAKKHKTAKKEKRLEKAGYYAKKGKFGFVKRRTRKNKSQKKKVKGGNSWLDPYKEFQASPEGIAAQERVDAEEAAKKKAREEEAAKKKAEEEEVAEGHRAFQRMADEAAAKHQGEGGKKKAKK
mgnify:CR=1 FL=1|tara:strand:+ start:3574 stop:4113 length:540 start_codon:yes stop_codon:yes gene_type:complete